MSSTLARLSGIVLSGIRQTTYLSAAKSSGFVASSSAILPPDSLAGFPGQFSPVSERLEEEVQQLVRDWEMSVDTDQLTDMEKRIHEAHTEAIRNKEEVYHDPETGYQVYSVYGHIKRGSCCGNACRHCPYQHENVLPRYKSIKKNNGAFYC